MYEIKSPEIRVHMDHPPGQSISCCIHIPLAHPSTLGIMAEAYPAVQSHLFNAADKLGTNDTLMNKILPRLEFTFGIPLCQPPGAGTTR